MAKAVKGNPALDRDSVRRFSEALDSVATAVAEILGNEHTLHNLGQDALDSIETFLRKVRIEADRGLLVFGRRRTLRARQSVGGAVGPLAKRVASLEKTTPAPGPDPEADSSQSADFLKTKLMKAARTGSRGR